MIATENDGVEFVEGLPRGSGGKGRKGIWVELLAPLLAQPGRWAIIHRGGSPKYAGGIAGNLTRARVQIPPGEWEFAARTVDGESRVYARYLGEGAGDDRR